MDTLKQNMTLLYYKNLETHAKKNNIPIKLPHVNLIENNIKDTENDIIATATETETMYSEDFVYKKPWNKLNSIHKIIKVKEFINKLDMSDMEMKKHLINQFTTMIKNKQLTKKSDVEYDHISGNIISIPSLKITK
jgi:hypothetical protein